MSAGSNHHRSLDTYDELEVPFSQIPDYQSNIWNEAQ
jgi:hypothetical protein